MGANRFAAESCSTFRRFIVKFDKGFYKSYAKVKGPKETWGKSCVNSESGNFFSICLNSSLCLSIKLNETNKHDRLQHRPPKFQQHKNRLICSMYVRHLITSLVSGLICICVMMPEVRNVWDALWRAFSLFYSSCHRNYSLLSFFQMDDHVILTSMMAEPCRYPCKVSKSTTIHSIWPTRDVHIGLSNLINSLPLIIEFNWFSRPS